MSIIRHHSVKIIRNRCIFVRWFVINSLKDGRVYATAGAVPEKPKNSHPDTETASSGATWLKLHYDRFIGTYEILSGMKEIRAAQEEVLKIQEKLKSTQDQRRVILQNLLDIRKNIQMLSNDIHAMDKGNPHYLELVKRQIELMQKEREVDNRFEFMDTNERELFTQLTSAVRTSHEKERFHADNAKYFSMVLSMFAAVFGILGTMLSYHFRNRQYRNISEQGEKIEQELQELRTEVKQSFVDFQETFVPILKDAIDQNLKHLKPMESEKHRESWTEYFYRHTNNVYRWFIPRR